ncbi:MAG TPA: hypothetical protein VE870_05220 [Bacteroidales bacterium]|nr:hypothetical protein [Bacteroidales bacterium]
MSDTNQPDFENQNNRPTGLFRDRNIVSDLAAPALYSRFAIRFFAIFCSTLVGGILMAINLHRLNKKTELLLVLLFSFMFTLGGAVLFTHYGPKFTNILIITNLIGSAILEELYWNRVIGKSIKYRRKQVWPVLLFVFLLSLPVLMTAV